MKNTQDTSRLSEEQEDNRPRCGACNSPLCKGCEEHLDEKQDEYEYCLQCHKQHRKEELEKMNKKPSKTGLAIKKLINHEQKHRRT